MPERTFALPRIHLAPPGASDSAVEVTELAASLGLVLDPWEIFFLNDALREHPERPGKWSAFEVAGVVARQNGKGSILEARELGGLFLFGERNIVHSAHEFDTSKKHFQRMVELVHDDSQFKARLKRNGIKWSHGSEGIYLKSGQELRFKTRTASGGRGLSGDFVVFDEAMEIRRGAIGALMPLVTTLPNPQIWYMGSAVDQKIHAHGVVFAALRSQAIKLLAQCEGLPEDEAAALRLAARLMLMEWSVSREEYEQDPARVRRDPDAIARANPNLHNRITLEYVLTEEGSAAMDAETYAVERLSVGDWPEVSDRREHHIDQELWRSLTAPASEMHNPVALALDVSPDRKWAAIGAAGWHRHADGRDCPVCVPGDERLRIHLEVIDHREGVGWVVDRLVQLVGRWGPCVVMIDGKGPAGSLIPKLADAGLQLVGQEQPRSDIGEVIFLTSSSQLAQACGGFYDAVSEAEVVHQGDDRLKQAIADADTRPLSEAWAWSRVRSTGDITALVVATLAHFGLMMFGTRPGTKVLEGSLMA